MRLTAVIAAGALVLTACAPATEETPAETPFASEEPGISLGRIREEGDFLSLVAGRQLVGKNGSLTVNAEGSYTGTDAGLPVTGRWEWRRPVWCAVPDGAEAECFAWDRIPAGIRRIRNQGMGGGEDYVIR